MQKTQKRKSKKKNGDFCKRVSSETRENEPESLEEEARTEKLFDGLVLPKWVIVGDESGLLRREKREEEEEEANGGGASIVVDAVC